MRRKITLERTFRAPIEDVWALWTTREGIESWWGPEGFRVKVRKLDLRPGGELLYDMIASAPEQIAFMKRSGMPTSHPARIVYTEIVPLRRLAYDHDVDFVPGVQVYNVATVVELQPTASGVRMALTFDAMHDDEWTGRQTAGWESELGKLDRLIDSSRRDIQVQKITPFLWFDGHAEEAAKLYVSIFPDSAIGTITRNVEGGPAPAGTVLSVSFRLAGQEFIALNGGPQYRFTEAVSFLVSCKTQAEIDDLWRKLTSDGGVPQRCGWLKDRYGLSWQVVPEGLGELLQHPAAVRAMLEMDKLDLARLRQAAAAG